MLTQNTNHLSGEASLYLRQHSANPVDWYPWSEEAWEKARKENKLVLVSIGYSSCHWCHVMERESFEDAEVAAIMNEHFISIKVDREERPDIDQVYMTAVQLMTGSGGWPLNCFTLPDGSPIFGGTYFPKESWKEVLAKLNAFYQSDPEKARQYAAELTEGISHTEIIGSPPAPFTREILSAAVAKWQTQLDTSEGGPNRSPKFPLPVNYRFLLRYAAATGDPDLLKHVELTLDKMAFGGIYDHVAGGFARYSTDAEWKVPHFEKMLYDNAQLAALYSSAYKSTKKSLYREVAEQTLQFLKREMSDGKGAYFSAIDADSEGEEGKFYVWTKKEIAQLKLPACGKADPLAVFSDYYNLNEAGHWEEDKHILLRKKPDNEIAVAHSVTAEELKTFVEETRKLLLEIRSRRVAPVTDKKVIASWNGLIITALCEAFEAFGDEAYRNEAIQVAGRIERDLMPGKGRVIHTASSKEKPTDGYMEDYAFVASAFIDLYQVTFDNKWLTAAKRLADHALLHFHDSTNSFFWFTSSLDQKLVARKKEVSDNVIPASNSEMAAVLFILGDYFADEKYAGVSEKMLSGIIANISQYPSSHANWMNLLMNHVYPFHELVILGSGAEEKRAQMAVSYLPNTIFAGSPSAVSTLPLFNNRFVPGKTLLYVCTNRTCKLPVESTQEALRLMHPGLSN